MKKILGVLGGLYLGFSLSYFTGLVYTDWQLYAIGIPTILFFILDSHYNKDYEVEE